MFVPRGGPKEPGDKTNVIKNENRFVWTPGEINMNDNYIELKHRKTFTG